MAFDFNSIWDNPQVMGGLMGLSNLRDPDSMGKALMAMQQMKQYNRDFELEKERTQSLVNWRNSQTRLAEDEAERMKGVHELARNAGAEFMKMFGIGGGGPTQPQPQGRPAARPDFSGGPTAPVFGNEVQGQPLPPAGQPQPPTGGNNANASLIPSPNQGSMGVAQEPPPPNVIKDFFRKVIVGKLEGGVNKDGSFAVSPKGAIGPSQILSGTARGVAQRLGIPYDEKKLHTDTDYNLTLGEEYFRQQVNTFGDLATASAAYNAGPGAVLTAKNRATKMGNPATWMSFMPPETQAYVQNGTGYSGGMIPEQLQRPAIQQAQSQQMQAWRAAKGLGGYLQAVGGKTPGDIGKGFAEMSDALKPDERLELDREKFVYQQGQDAYTNALAAGKSAREAAEERRKAEESAYKITQRQYEEEQRAAETKRIRSQTLENEKQAEAKQQEMDIKVSTELQGHQTFSTTINQVLKDIEELRKMGGVIDTDKDEAHNLWVAAKLDPKFQAAQRALGTKEQELRDKIQNSLPVLMTAMKTATGMGVRQFDTEKELEFYKQAFGDPKTSYQAQIQALERFSKLYGEDSPAAKALKNTDAGKKYLETQKSRGNDMTSTPGKGTAENPYTLEELREMRRKK